MEKSQANQVKQSLTSEIATREFALGAYAGFFNFLPDPDPILRKLGADQTVYKDLLADDQVGPLYNRRKNLTKSLDWYVEPGDAGEREVELCEAALKLMEGNGCKVKDIIDQTLNPIGFGYSVFEINYQRVSISKSQSLKVSTKETVRPGDGETLRKGDVWLPVSAWEKPREWFFFDNKNQLRFRTQVNSEGIVIIGPDADPAVSIKFILLQNNPTYENPYGDKALSRCFWPVSFKKGGMKFFSIFIEKYGMPYLFGKLPRGAKPEEHAALLEKLENMVSDTVATGPDDSSLQLLEATGTRSADLYKGYLQHCDNAIAKSILGNALSTDIQATGARAVGEVGAVTIEGDIGETDRDFPTTFFNELFKRIVDINIGSGLYPTFEVKELDESRKEFAERDNILSQAFSASGQKIKFKKEYLINNYGYDEKEFEVEESQSTVLSPQSAVPEGQKPEAGSHPAKREEEQKEEKQNAELSLWKKIKNLFRIELADPQPLRQRRMSLRLTTPNSLAEQLTDALPDKLLQFQMEETLAPVFELAEKAESREEFINGLAALYPKMETKQLEDLATKVFLIAEIEGRLDASQQ